MNYHPPSHSNGIAAVLSFLIPGLGHLYKGRIIGGLLWLGLVPPGYAAFVIPGLVLHFFCILRSATVSSR